ncbi:MAG: hypothetical protein JXR76_08745 [Deltaproteobacteria bacterium]|nr:hypothetical protein [Deltaproteobacteria bacterium]
MNRFLILVFILGMLLFSGCRNDGDDGSADAGVSYYQGEPLPVDGTCTSVRLTAYEAGDSGWCEWRASHDFLPQFVRDGMHTAIAQPWNNGSFEGDEGEACGECWEINTVNATGIVMVNNLCPIEGNPLCSGGHFHFDLSTEAAATLGGGGLDEASARRVPCPVEGSIYVQVNDANEWGYLRFAPMNHRVPVRRVDVAASPDGPWVAVERSGGAMHVKNGPTPDEGDGIYFRLTSTLAEQVVSTRPVPYLSAKGSAHELGIQFTQIYEPAECAYQPPGDVYIDRFGGIEGVVWQPNPWGDNSEVKETGSGCRNGSASCLQVQLDTWGGAHFYYRQAFPASAFTTASLWVNAAADMQLTVAPSNDGERCTEQRVALTGGQWTEVTFELATACTGFAQLNGITIAGSNTPTSMTLDDIRFE